MLSENIGGPSRYIPAVNFDWSQIAPKFHLSDLDLDPKLVFFGLKFDHSMIFCDPKKLMLLLLKIQESVDHFWEKNQGISRHY